MIVAETYVGAASQGQFDLLDVSISGAIEEMGGPPAGLMAHVVRPDGDGFVICDVWRTTEEMRRFNDDILQPRVVASGLAVRAEVVSPVWSFARP